ncbi:MAG: molybdenum cofactor biosynthesis protein MoaE [Thermoplasmata archaeon]|nr:molybdenum cofactor biosynthesis protein MoaE [Thermoplasmata archaeon]
MERCVITEKEIKGVVPPELLSGRVGAVVTFTGVVRGEEMGRRVRRMYIEAEEEGAVKSFVKIREEAMERFGIEDMIIIHRVGYLKVGEAIVFIAALSSHREEGFRACRFAIDRLKEISPIWKKVYLEGGEQIWIENR